ncbi:MAG: universal stress protein, partial [Kofleriaceae bacterium]
VEIDVSGSGPARTLLERAAACDADLVLVSSHGRGGVARAREIPLGSVPERLFSELACGLLIVPALAEATAQAVSDAASRSPGTR